MTGTQATSRKQKTREQILLAARALFLQYGFAATSTDAIMARAGIASKETLYRHYASKEELFVAVLQDFTVENPQHTGLLQMPVVLESREDLQAFFLRFAQNFLAIMAQPDYPAFVRMLIAELPRFPYLGELFRVTVPERALQFLVIVLEQARQKGLVNMIDANAIIRMLVGSLLTYALLDGVFQMEKSFSPPPPEQIEAIVASIMKAVA
jgi:TetR/AcrR family transcriptional repressor of mexJK operon